MGKKLISAKCVDEFICKASGKIYVDNAMILSPGAKDKLRDEGIAIVYGPRPEVAEEVPAAEAPAAEACDGEAPDAGVALVEKVISIIARILKEEHGMTDPDQMVQISSRVVNTLKENL